jgi:hypothetical protein
MRAPLAQALAVVAAFLPLAAAAQSIQGTVVDELEESPLQGVRLVLLDARGTVAAETISDEDGAFLLEPPRSGEWVIAADLIGYGDLVSEPVEVGTVEQVSVKIRMAVEAVALEPLVVIGRVRYANGDLAAFYDRMERGRRSGLGRFVSRQDIEDRRPLHPTDLVRGHASIRTVRTRYGRGDALRMAGGCTPAIFIDGSHINRFNPDDSLDDYVAVHSIEGIEIYRGSSSQVGRFHDPRGCGLILVWTRRGVAEGEGGPFSWKRLAAGLALIGALFLLK